jgi:hypothetical protein
MPSNYQETISMRKTVNLIAVLLLSILTMAAAQEAEMDNLRQEIDAGNAAWIAAWAKSDASLIANA